LGIPIRNGQSEKRDRSRQNQNLHAVSPIGKYTQKALLEPHNPTNYLAIPTVGSNPNLHSIPTGDSNPNLHPIPTGDSNPNLHPNLHSIPNPMDVP
jgi:hypothetical protein